MIKNVSEVKNSLDELVLLAAKGEEIVITVQGQPMARLTGISSSSWKGTNSREEWASELAAVAESVCAVEPASTAQQFWDELRADRC